MPSLTDALEALSRPDTYLVENIITDGQGFGLVISRDLVRELRRRQFVQSRLHPEYLFLTSAGRKSLAAKRQKGRAS